MTEYIRLRQDLSVPLWKALEMLNTPVRYTCWNENRRGVQEPFRVDEREEAPVVPVVTACSHQWVSNLLAAEIGQNMIRCPICDSPKLSFKRMRTPPKNNLDENALREFLAACG
jgi:hypothetical protein